jgi:hypothetical protein
MMGCVSVTLGSPDFTVICELAPTIATAMGIVSMAHVTAIMVGLAMIVPHMFVQMVVLGMGNV